MDWLDRSFQEELHHVWFDHGNFFGSRVREEMNGDEEAARRVKQFENAWRNLYEYVQNTSEKERLKKQIVKPMIRRVMRKLIKKQQ